MESLSWTKKLNLLQGAYSCNNVLSEKMLKNCYLIFYKLLKTESNIKIVNVNIEKNCVFATDLICLILLSL